MTLADLIARLDAADITVRLVGGKPKLLFPPGMDSGAFLKEHGDDLTTHRAAVLDHYSPQEAPEHPGRVCLPCGATMYHDSAEDQYRFCGLIQCPAWRPGLASAPEWAGAARESMQWQAKRQREKKIQQDQPVPE